MARSSSTPTERATARPRSTSPTRDAEDKVGAGPPLLERTANHLCRRRKQGRQCPDQPVQPPDDHRDRSMGRRPPSLPRRTPTPRPAPPRNSTSTSSRPPCSATMGRTASHSPALNLTVQTGTAPTDNWRHQHDLGRDQQRRRVAIGRLEPLHRLHVDHQGHMIVITTGDHGRHHQRTGRRAVRPPVHALER